MGGVCCRSHHGSFEDDVLRFQTLSLDLRPAADAMATTNTNSMSISSSRSEIRPRVATATDSAAAAVARSNGVTQLQNRRSSMTQSLVNYVSFPFPFVKRPKVVMKKAQQLRKDTSSKGRKKNRQYQHNDATTVRMTAYVGDYWRKTPQGTFMPLSLLECCVRQISIWLVNDQIHFLHGIASNRKQIVFPTELASAIMQWLRTHHALGKAQFQHLLPSLLHGWNLQNHADVTDAWFADGSLKTMQHIKSIDLTGCEQIERFGPEEWLEGETFPSLTIASFQGCANIQSSVMEMFQCSTHLTSLNVSGCRNIDDRSLHSLRHLFKLRVLDLGGCRLVTDSGVKYLFGLKKLEKLILARCSKLTDGVFEKFAASFPELKSLDVAQCRLSERALQHIGRIISLKTLIIRSCSDIRDEGMIHLTKLVNLEFFDARHCENLHSLSTEWKDIRVLLLARTAFAEADAAVLQEMSKLQELDLRACRIMKRGFEFISRLPNIERLVLAETALTDISLLEICKNAKKLKALDISTTEISDAGTEGLATLKDLEILRMDTPGVTNRSLANLSFLPMLEKLDLFGASITDNGLLHLVPLRCLKELEVCGGNISDRGVELISKITTLTSLNLSQNRNIHAKSLCFIRSLVELRSLNLSNTSITALSLRHLYPLKDLQTLSVYGCALTSSHIEGLRGSTA